MKIKPDLGFWKLFTLSFGFFGVQIAYALQSANISRIFATLGADPHQLSFFWILPPLMGMVVQPLVGFFSDRTWTKLGRRLPYLIVGAIVAVIVMCLLPNAGSLGITTQIVMWGLSGTMLFGLFSLMLLDTSINMAMQPFKMLVGDMVNEKQKGLAYSIQSMLCNAGSVVGFCAPYILSFLGVKNVAAAGVIPDSVIFSFYIGAAILILCVIFTTSKVKEFTPEEYKMYNDANNSANGKSHAKKKVNIVRPFVTIGLVQFFCWAAFLFQWTYATGAIAENCWGTTDASSAGFQEAGDWYGIMSAVMAITAMLWAMVIPMFKNIKVAYILSLLLGAIGFASCLFVTNQYVLIVSFALQGCTWAAMLAIPFALFTNAIEGDPRTGTLLGLFNCVICMPQIIAAIAGGLIVKGLGLTQPYMMFIAGCLLLVGVFCVPFIRTTRRDEKLIEQEELL
ncbi:MAG: MFS transporter [Muribaculaceae bacterium]|nr:MFS transporter [Muribaculaceae bacterium]